MAINFTDSPSNGATQTISGRTYTYNSAKNKWDTTATEVTGPTAAVYATVNDLPGSATTGDQAFVSGTNRLYIWNGSGWYNIALVNNTPTWTTQPNSSYALAIDGTATTITIVAADPEGLPITYSIASDTSGSIATVTQGTGANVNTFTITPSTSSADAGTFSLTFRATDGINVVSAISSFTLTFSVVNQRYTTALITTAGNAGINNSFTDSSGNSHTVSVTGDATQNSFSPYRHAGYSMYFDGSGDYLEIPNAAGNAASDTFTVEFWVKDPEVVSGSAPFYTQGSGSSNAAFAMDWTGTAIRVDYYGNNISHTVDLEDGAWHHIAATVNGTTGDRKLWLNGSLVASDQNTNGTFSATNCVIGRMPWASRVYKGYMRDFRISDSIRYSTTFTPPEEPFISDSNTKILTCHLPYLVDNSTNAHTITRQGNPTLEPVSPYDSEEYVVGSHGGSVHLDGTGDRLTVGSTTDLGFGTGDFTIEYWIKHEGKLSGSNYPYAFDMRSQDNEAKLALYHRTNVNNIVGIYVSQNTIVSGTNQMYDGMDWVHYAICKTGGYLKGYFNGKQDFSVADSTDYGSSGQISIGSTYSNLYHMQGHIADFRVVKGTAVYTAEFTPPTAPLTAITNTSLLLNMQGAKIFDKAQGNAEKLTLAGNTTASTAAYKYLPTSMYFDGNTDYIQLEGMDDRYYDDFTVEGWYKFNTYNNSSGANTRLFASRQGGNHADNLQIIVAKATDSGSAGAGTISVYTNAYQITGSAISVADNNWHHIAVSRQGTSLKLFVDGTHTGTTKTTSQSFLFWDTRLATRDTTAGQVSRYTGYMSEVRITKGLARYTANFTPPSAALQG